MIVEGDVKIQDTANTNPTEPTVAPTQGVVNKGTEPEVAAGAMETPEAPVEKTIPYSRFKEVNENFKKVQRDLAKLQGEKATANYDPEDMSKVMSHPFVQELLMKTAESELKEGVKEILDRYPAFPKSLAKAIVRNPRGYVAPQTTDIPNALLDIEEYIAEIAAETETPTEQPKSIQVAATNQPPSAQGGTPLDVQKILAKPILEWTEAEAKIVETYTGGSKV